MRLTPPISKLKRWMLAWQLRGQQQLARWGIREQTLLIGLSFVVGLLTGVATWLFEQTVKLIENHYYLPAVKWTHATTWWPCYIFLPLIPAGGGLALVLWRRLWGRHDAKLHGLAGLLHSLSRESGKLKASLGIETLVASSLTIGSGGSAGPEAPIAVIGASIGALCGNTLGFSRRNMPILLGCGAAAGISAVFGAPIAGVLFAMEVLLRDFSVRTLTPIVISSVMASTMYVGLSGGGAARGLFQMPTSGPAFVFTFGQLPYYLLLGAVCGLLAVGFTRFYVLVEDFSQKHRKRIPYFLHPAIGAALTGVCGIAMLIIFRDDPFLQQRFAQGYMPIFSAGYPTILRMIDPRWYSGVHILGGHTATLTLEFLVVVCFLKIIATAFTLAPGGSGGVFAPALFIGAAGGGAVGLVLTHYGLVGDPSTYALVGMGAVLAATIQAPLTAIILLFELTQNYAVMVPIMLAAVTATIIQQLMVGESLYTLPLKKLGVNLGSAVGISALQRIGVDQLVLGKAPVARPDESLSSILARSHEEGVEDFVVMDKTGNYLGLLTIDDLKTVLLEPEAAPLLLVGEVMRADVPPIKFHDTLDAALAMFGRFEVSRLAVLDDTNPAEKTPGLLGFLTRSALMKRYQQELSGDSAL